MSSEEEGGVGLKLSERFFGLIMLIVGALAVYYTATSFDVLNGFVGFFGFLCAILIVIGWILLTAKTE
jgi:hypothetical protein